LAGALGALGALGSVAHSLRDPAGVVKANAPAWQALTGSAIPKWREAENDIGPLARRAVDVHHPPEAASEPSHDGQPQAAPADVLVGAVERLEGALEHVALHAHAGIAHLDAIGLHDHPDGAFRGERAGVAHQLLHDDR